MIKVPNITIKKLKNGSLAKTIPEFYELNKVIENNDWHRNDSVFNHTINVLINLKKLFKKYDKKLGKYLNEKVGNHARGQLLFLSALFHDIAKKETIVKNGGITLCPGHEAKGAIKAWKILKRFELSFRERKWIVKIVKNHGLAGKMPAMGNAAYLKFKKTHKNLFVGLLLLAVADMLGTQLKSKHPNNFAASINFYTSVIKNYRHH